MCSSLCLKDTCSLIELDWSLMFSCGYLYVFMVVVVGLLGFSGFLWSLGEARFWWGYEGLRYILNRFLLGSMHVFSVFYWNALRALPAASLWLDSCVKWFAVVGSCRALTSRWNYCVVIYKFLKLTYSNSWNTSVVILLISWDYVKLTD